MPASKKDANAGRSTGSLATYKKKRDFGITPEPSGSKSKKGPALRFVIQKHDATRLHYDFRLEAAGVLASWAVPKGPTLVPGERRLAMHVEDHPMDYRDFEGVIPSGQYGAGEVIVWDNGTYELAEGTDPAREIEGGKIKFIMSGEKLRGMFTLVRMKPKEGERGDPWLLIKDRDGNDPKSWDVNDYPESVQTGRTLDDIRNDPGAKTWHSKAKKSAVPKARARARAEPLPHITAVELATLIEEPFDDEDWLFEIKWDGYRAIATIDGAGTLTLVSRNGLDLLAKFPPLAGISDAFASVPIVVDGEIVSLDERGRSDFQRLQEHGTRGHRLTYAAFDVLYADGRDQRDVALEERKTLLERLIRSDDGIVLYSKHVIGNGTALFAQAGRNKLEGIIGKRRDSRYVARRTRDWVKIKAQLEQEFVIGGWTEPRGSRTGFGSLLLGAYDGKVLRYVGHVGTGFSVKRIVEIKKLLERIERATSPFAGEIDANTKAHWVKPELVAQVRFAEWTRDGILRQPAFLGLRADKAAKDVVLELPQPLETT
ncbi:MAG: non-homologous end-joining DNA ligase [Candidatus Eremiobacteraeota bacterium]|nr:non-homologous end-joining DNA ligase [Candidatus Eremiobacteraeota bacterium]